MAGFEHFPFIFAMKHISIITSGTRDIDSGISQNNPLPNFKGPQIKIPILKFSKMFHQLYGSYHASSIPLQIEPFPSDRQQQ